jgi:hypothetical protein
MTTLNGKEWSEEWSGKVKVEPLPEPPKSEIIKLPRKERMVEKEKVNELKEILTPEELKVVLPPKEQEVVQEVNVRERKPATELIENPPDPVPVVPPIEPLKKPTLREAVLDTPITPSPERSPMVTMDPSLFKKRVASLFVEEKPSTEPNESNEPKEEEEKLIYYRFGKTTAKTGRLMRQLIEEIYKITKEDGSFDINNLKANTQLTERGFHVLWNKLNDAVIGGSHLFTERRGEQSVYVCNFAKQVVLDFILEEIKQPQSSMTK